MLNCFDRLGAGKANALAGAVCSALLLMGAAPARADLIQDTSVQVQGSGLGAVNTLVTVQDNSETSPESGCVTPTGGASFSTGICLNGVEGGDEKPGSSQTRTRLVSNISSTEAGDLALVVNIAETGQDLTVVLTDLYLALYSTSGMLLGNFEYTGPDLLLTQGSGTGLGGAGFVFVLDDAQATQANDVCPILTQCYAGGGVQFAAGSTNNGPDTVYIIAVDDGIVQPPQQVPEPGALALFGVAGLLGAAAARRRRAPSA